MTGTFWSTDKDIQGVSEKIAAERVVATMGKKYSGEADGS